MTPDERMNYWWTRAKEAESERDQLRADRVNVWQNGYGLGYTDGEFKTLGHNVNPYKENA